MSIKNEKIATIISENYDTVKCRIDISCLNETTLFAVFASRLFFFWRNAVDPRDLNHHKGVQPSKVFRKTSQEQSHSRQARKHSAVSEMSKFSE